ncbi:FtsB family cell division protein [Alteribacter natronophilus]|uniref:FtsB family cell division protein n=1 Tax=Alteribacter natronophilus TaxID=2583810 RepID=UPI00110F01F7|nr:septum formation initiator family protein [Alteribacter natronophilus]TMW69948.1 septum formation initiator family protein [Alteribacter natronophilus]
MHDQRRETFERLASKYAREQELLQEQKRRRRKGLVRRMSIFAVLMTAGLIFTVYTLFSQHSTMQQQENEQAELTQQLAELEQEELALREEKELLQDYDYIAEIARRDYFLSKPGETLFQLPQASSD